MSLATLESEPRTRRDAIAGRATRIKFAIVGGGLVGLGTAHELKRLAPGAEVQVFRNDAIDLAVSTAHVATDAHVMRGMGGIDAAVEMVRARSGKGYAPRVAEALVNHAPVVLADDAPSLWDAVLAAEPGPHRRLSGDDAERAKRPRLPHRAVGRAVPRAERRRGPR